MFVDIQYVKLVEAELRRYLPYNGRSTRSIMDQHAEESDRARHANAESALEKSALWSALFAVST